MYILDKRKSWKHFKKWVSSFFVCKLKLEIKSQNEKRFLSFYKSTLYLKELFENRTVEAENELVRVDVDVVLCDEGHVGQVPGLMNFC